MTMTLRVRKLALTLHVTSSVGWLGAVAGFLALAISGLTSQDPQVVRAAYLATEMLAWAVIVPLGLASLPTGVLMSIVTEWGPVRHYWVLAKALITVVATILLLVHMQPVGHLARVVAATTLANGELAGLRIQLVADAGAALVALFVATALSVYKPRGLTPYGRRKLSGYGGEAQSASVNVSERWTRVALFAGLLLLALFVIQHLAASGSGGH